MKWLRGFMLPTAIAMVFILATIVLATYRAMAAAPDSSLTQNRDFSLQVTPSPLVATVKPGEANSVELKVRNNGTGTEKLKIEPRSFSLSRDSEQIKIDDTTPPEFSRWISFDKQKFEVAPGQIYTQNVIFNFPKDTGFSYSFVLIISRQSERTLTSGGRLIKGSVAVFTLVNVDRPGATRKLDVVTLESDRKLYEFLPAKLNVQLKNDGNTIVQPYGNIFIQRGSSQITTLTVNEQRGYILPRTTRIISAEWNDGFPRQKITVNSDGSQSTSLVWNWSEISKLRFGKYTAKVVAVYNNGGHDVPIQGEVSFWVVPWRAILLLIFIVAGLWWLQHWRVKRKTEKAIQKALAQAQAKKEESK